MGFYTDFACYLREFIGGSVSTNTVYPSGYPELDKRRENVTKLPRPLSSAYYLVSPIRHLALRLLKGRDRVAYLEDPCGVDTRRQRLAHGSVMWQSVADAK